MVKEPKKGEVRELYLRDLRDWVLLWGLVETSRYQFCDAGVVPKKEPYFSGQRGWVLEMVRKGKDRLENFKVRREAFLRWRWLLFVSLQNLISCTRFEEHYYAWVYFLFKILQENLEFSYLQFHIDFVCLPLRKSYCCFNLLVDEVYNCKT